MQTLEQTFRAGGGEPLPDVFQALAAAGIHLRRGQVIVVAAEPNAGKSLFALSYAIQVRVPALVFSADTDQRTTAIRAASALTGQSQSVVEKALQGPHAEFYLEQIRSLDHMQFSFDPAPMLEDLELEVEAFEEMWGQEPELIVIDNLMNIHSEDGDEWKAMREAMKALHYLARQSGAAVMVLHHTSENSRHETACPPRRAIQGKVNQLPELILTLGRTGIFLAVAAVKNRNGPADPSGTPHAFLYLDPERVQLADKPPAAAPVVQPHVDHWSDIYDD